MATKIKVKALTKKQKKILSTYDSFKDTKRSRK